MKAKVKQRRLAAFAVLAILTTGLLIAGCDNGTTTTTTPPAPTGQLWYYTAFGQSVDLRFHNSANIPDQDGINNVWINPEWLDEPDLMDSTPVMGQVSWNGSNTYENQPGNHVSIFTKSSLFIPPLEGAMVHGVPVNISETDRIVIESRGGKITTGHDGLTFLYTPLPSDGLYKLTADITKSSIGSHPAAGSNGISNQTGAGIMARDFVAANRQDPYLDGYEEVPAPSNYVGVGLWQNDNISRPGQSYRINVTSKVNAVGSTSNRGAAGGNNTTNPNSNSEVGITFTYTLERTNEGYFYEVTKKEDGSIVVPRVQIPNSTPDMLQVLDEDTMYWGFCASREIRILVENVRLERIDTAEFEPTEPPVLEALVPNAAVLMRSRNKTTRATAVLALRPNHDGQMIVTDPASATVYDGAVTAYNEVYIDVDLAEGENTFHYEFTTGNPEVSVKTASGDARITRSAAIPSTDWGSIYAAPEARGSGDGSSAANAMAIGGAIAAVEPGQTIYLVNAVYGTINIGNNNSGTRDQYVKIMPAPGVSQQIRARNVSASNNSSYIHIVGIKAGGEEGARYNGTPFNMGGNSDYMIVENCTAQWSTATGFSIGGSGASGNWPKYNTWLNCTAIHNEDDAMQNADGFAMQLFGIGNKYIGCIAAYAGDDGWDHFLRVGDGSGGDIYYENCIAYSNNANGFKLGGEGQPTPMYLVDCLAYDNGMAGFSDNFNPGSIVLERCIGVDNHTQNFIMRDNPNYTPEQRVINSISFRSKMPDNLFMDAVAGTVENSALILNAGSIDSYRNGTLITASMFASMDRSKAYTRAPDGTLYRGLFARFLAW